MRSLGVSEPWVRRIIGRPDLGDLSIVRISYDYQSQVDLNYFNQLSQHFAPLGSQLYKSSNLNIFKSINLQIFQSRKSHKNSEFLLANSQGVPHLPIWVSSTSCKPLAASCREIDTTLNLWQRCSARFGWVQRLIQWEIFRILKCVRTLVPYCWQYFEWRFPEI